MTPDPAPAAASMKPPILELVNLHKSYGANQVLKGINLRVRAGELVCVIGPSGSGKSSMLRCCNRLEEPSGGQIVVDGVDITRAGVDINRVRQGIGMVFQSFNLYPHLNVLNNVSLALRKVQKLPRAEAEQRALAALARVELQEKAGAFPAQLSGGQQQRVALARAIINRPKVLLLDEPLGALDLKLRKHMQIELKRLQEQLGITFVFVTHDQEEALVMADRIAVMNAGKIEQIGTGEEIYRSPASLFVADFIGDANLIDVEVAGTGEMSLARGGDFLGRLQTASVGSFRMLARPEQLSFLGPDSAPPTLRLAATITRSIFVGDALRVYADLADGTEVAVKLVDERARMGLATGQQVSIGWYGDDARLFPMPR